MCERCHNPNHKNFKTYGARGIKVCEQWRGKGGPEIFVQDMGFRPSPAHSIDRIDTNADYCPENCRWTTQKQQCRNKNNNVLLTHADKTQTMAEWAEELGIAQQNLRSRLRNNGWDIGKIIARTITTSDN
jgi:hypothetical protein